MAQYRYATNGEPVKCVNCGNLEFKRRPPEGKNSDMAPYECGRCHFISWFPADFAPQEDSEKDGKPDVIAL